MYRIAIAAAFMALCVTATEAASNEPHVISGFTMERVAHVPDARELAIAPNGDLFVGTGGSDVYLVRHAEGSPSTPHIVATFGDGPAAGVALSRDALFVGTQFAIYRIPYRAGYESAPNVEKIASVRTSGVSSDHVTTSVAWDGRTLYASIGSSCNGCVPELDDTRATIQRVDFEHHTIAPVATHIRNAIALTIDPKSRDLWAGVAGIDDLEPGHPYEIFDDVTSHKTPVDYGWPSCYENRKVHPKWPADCSRTPLPRVVFPAYETPIGAVFYPATPSGRHDFPQTYRGGAFVTLHGSWHNYHGLVPPRIAFVRMHGDEPAHAVNWNDPNAQWTQFVGDYQSGGTGERIGRPTGITVGPEGSLFVADDETGAIYRIRPK